MGMSDTEKLYETLGELLYVVAKADGVIRNSEREKLNEILKGHSWADQIKWSFDYEVKKNTSVEELYKKVITYCEMHGPDQEYQFLLNLVEEVAAATNGIDKDEKEVMDVFVYDLTEKFRSDLGRING